VRCYLPGSLDPYLDVWPLAVIPGSK
jgi:hypothetical protein